MDATAFIRGGTLVGRLAVRLGAMVTLVLVMLGAVAGAANAEEPITVPNLTKEEFIKACLDNPGVPIVTEYPNNTVMCEHDDGSFIICNFNSPVICTPGGILPDPDHRSPGTHSEVDGSGVLSGETPTAERTQTANPSAGQTLDDQHR